MFAATKALTMLIMLNSLNCLNWCQNKGICPLVATVLSILYANQSVKTGGGRLSPILFAMYIDELLIRLQNYGNGCYIGCVFVGCFGYADDALLIATIYSLKLMLNIVINYCDKYSI